MHCSLLSLGCVFGFAPPENHVSFTALRALKIAQRRLRPEVRSKLLSVVSARSGSALVPDAWRFAFLDEATSGGCRIVTVAAKTSSEHPDAVEAFSGLKSENASGNVPIAQAKLLVDSDAVLARAREAAKLKGIQAAEYRLQQLKANSEPTWTIQFYVDQAAPFAHVKVGAKTGAVDLQCNNDKVPQKLGIQ